MVPKVPPVISILHCSTPFPEPIPEAYVPPTMFSNVPPVILIIDCS